MERNLLLYTKLMKEVKQLITKYPEEKALPLIDRHLSEKHRVAFQLTKFENQIANKSLSTWVTHFKQEELDDLFQYAERGYAQNLEVFGKLLKILGYIRDIGNPISFTHRKFTEKSCDTCKDYTSTCPKCMGTGYYPELVIVRGTGTAHFNEVVDSFTEDYIDIGSYKKIREFNIFLVSYDNEVSVETPIRHYEEHRKKLLRPYCQTERNLRIANLSNIAFSMLKKHGLKDEAEELRKRILPVKGYLLQKEIIEEYVNLY